MGRRISPETIEIMRFIKQLEEEEDQVTQRHLFYRCVDQGFIDKDNSGEDKVASVIFHMRWGVSRTNLRGNRCSYLPDPTIPDELRLFNWEWIVDSTRRAQWTATWPSPADRITAAAENYRRSVLAEADTYVEVYSEKDALKPLLWPVCKHYDVPLSSTKGQDSHPPKHALYARVKDAVTEGKPAVLLVLADYDPSGRVIVENFEKLLVDFCRLDGVDEHEIMDSVIIEHVALTREQIDKYKLPTRPTKRDGNTHAQRFEDDQSVELDALRPNILRQLLRKEIERYVPPGLVGRVRSQEERERKKLTRLAATFKA